MKRYSMPTARRIAWAAKQAAEVRKQIDRLQRPAGSNWRPYAGYDRTLNHLLAKEARFRQIAAPSIEEGDPLPF